MWETDDLIKIDEVARICNVSMNTVYRWLRHGVPKRVYRGKRVDVEILPDKVVLGKRCWSREATLQLAREINKGVMHNG